MAKNKLELTNEEEDILESYQFVKRHKSKQKAIKELIKEAAKLPSVKKARELRD